MENLKEFEKLFKVNIPVKSEAEYYLNTLKKSKQFSKLEYQINEFEKFESSLKEKGFSSIGNYKMDFAFYVLKQKIEESETYKKFQEFDYSKVPFRSKDKLKINQGEFLVSFDLKQANFNCFKSFDNKENPEFSKTWEEQFEDMGIEKSLGLSKSFRQLVFGNINPKRNQKIQHMFMLSFIDKLFENGYVEEDIVFISHDEVIIKGVDDKWLNKGFDGIYYLPVGDLIGGENEMVFVPLKSTIFKMNKIPDTKVFIKTIYENLNYGFAGIQLTEAYKELWGAPGTKFYLYFKKYILEEEIEDRDLMFFSDGMYAKWIIND